MSRVLLAGLALIVAALTFDATVAARPRRGAGRARRRDPAVDPACRARRVRRTAGSHGDRVEEDQPLEATIEVRRGRLGLPGGQVLDELHRRAR